jgi:hypothetical protein
MLNLTLLHRLHLQQAQLHPRVVRHTISDVLLSIRSDDETRAASGAIADRAAENDEARP